MHRCKDTSCMAFKSCGTCTICGGKERQHFPYTDSLGYKPRWWEQETSIVTVAGRVEDDPLEEWGKL